MWVPKAALPQEGETSPCFENAFCFLSFREWVRGFYDLLRKKPSSQFMPLGCSSISITSLRATCLDFLARMLKLMSRMSQSRSMLCSAEHNTDLHYMNKALHSSPSISQLLQPKGKPYRHDITLL